MGGNFVCCGDFNIDLLDFESYKCKLFNNFLKDLGLLQIIRDATRVTRTSRTLVDLILTSEDSSACAAGVQSVGLSDHELIHCTLSCPERLRNLSFTFRDFKNMPLDDEYKESKTRVCGLYMDSRDTVGFHINLGCWLVEY
ncbi:Endonuclease-reverse transcriptase [Popillia japonica]|uniref:Endonuclease-reverse transcriptase n=1 Tax=Popillia japonica TaxID=7064 RepID=A0AAW1IGM7_POPJA